MMIQKKMAVLREVTVLKPATVANQKVWHRVNSDDTYDIEYDDGDTEREEKVTCLGGDSKRMCDDDTEEQIFARGDRVYRGKSKWYKGKITR